MFVSGFHLRERSTLEECRKGKCVCLRCLENKNAVEMQSIYKPGGADTRETWFSIATFCTFRPFSLFGSDFQLFKLSCSNSKFCFYPALACLNIQATSNISKIWLIPFVQRVRNLCLLSSLLTLNLKNELEIFNTWFTVLLGISSGRSPRTAWLLSSVGDYVPCQKFAPAKT